MPRVLMPISPIALGCRVRQLWADTHEIARHGAKNGPGGFDGDRLAGISQALRQWLQVVENHGLATGDHDVIHRGSNKFAKQIFYRSIRPFGFPTCVRGVAPSAAQVAAAQSDKR